MLREVGRSLTGVPVGLVVDLVQPEFLVRRLLARGNKNNNNHRQEGHPAPRNLEPVKTGKLVFFFKVVSFLSYCHLVVAYAVRNLVIGEKKGNGSSLVKGLVIDREKAIERISTTGTAVEKERAGVQRR